MRPVIFAAALLTFAAAIAPSIASAHARLVSATPAANATVARAGAISLTFSEDVAASLSGMNLVMTAMPGMADHKPMPVKGISATAKGRTLAAILPRPLPSGTYELSWYVVAADQHRVEGSYAFIVR
jgi:methionine-rich copper-binding protein CopC